jgi:hypothetical protein
VLNLYLLSTFSQRKVLMVLSRERVTRRRGAGASARESKVSEVRR